MLKNRSRCVRTLPSAFHNNLPINPHPPPELIIGEPPTGCRNNNNKQASLSDCSKQFLGEHIDTQYQGKQRVSSNAQPAAPRRRCPSKLFSDDPPTIDRIILDINNLDTTSNKSSSSSSLSWNNDGHNSEITNRIGEELQRIERIFAGLEPIPDHYDQKEYRQWMDTFPNLSIVGTSISNLSSYYEPTSDDGEDASEEEDDDVIVIHPPNNDTNKVTSICMKNRIKETVIDRIYMNVSHRLLKIPSHNKSLSSSSTPQKTKSSPKRNHHQRMSALLMRNNPNNKNPTDDHEDHHYHHNINCISSKFLNDNDNENASMIIDDYLRISPVVVSPARHPSTGERRQSSKSLLISSQMSSSRWLKNDSPPPGAAVCEEYASLPFVDAGGSLVSSRDRATPLLQRRSVGGNASIVLPPIEGNFRSISATPRRGQQRKTASSCSSALSMKIEEDLMAGSRMGERFKGLYQHHHPMRRLSLCRNELIKIKQ